ncbi:MAG: hypothetical protein AAF682_19575 [Planctomycetota bacterium]
MAKRKAKGKPERLGLRAYARHRGVSLPAVQKAISTGRLSDSITRGGPSKGYPNGRVFIDPEVADREWDENTDPAQQRSKHRKAKPKREEPNLFSEGDPLPEGQGDGPRPPKLAEVQAERTKYQAKIAQLDWRERVGELGDVDRMRRHAFKIAHAVRQAIDQVADRLAAKVAAESEVEACRLLLQGAHDKALAALAEAVPKMEVDEADGRDDPASG